MSNSSRMERLPSTKIVGMKQQPADCYEEEPATDNEVLVRKEVHCQRDWRSQGPSPSQGRLVEFQPGDTTDPQDNQDETGNSTWPATIRRPWSNHLANRPLVETPAYRRQKNPGPGQRSRGNGEILHLTEVQIEISKDLVIDKGDYQRRKSKQEEPNEKENCSGPRDPAKCRTVWASRHLRWD